MAKVQICFTVLFFLLLGFTGSAQEKYILHIQPVDKPASVIQNTLPLQTGFLNKEERDNYISQLLPALQAKGYITASIDSVFTDSLQTTLQLYIGPQYKWQHISSDAESRKWLSVVGWQENFLAGKLLDFNAVYDLQQRMLNYFENNGYPFAKIYLDNMQVDGDMISGSMKVQTGPLYKVDSIKIVGNAKISADYLQRYLDIKNGSAYNKEKLQKISAELQKLNYIEETLPPRFYWGSTGGVVELYLQQKKSNQVNFIVGFLPNNEQLTSKKMLITGEALLNLKNALGSGETIGLVWQKLQVSSQRLNVVYKQPYLFRSPFGLDFSFDMFKKDSSFLNFDFKLGARYSFSSQQSAAVFFQQSGSIVNSINTTDILKNRKLPQDADIRVTQLGIEYNLNTTNYIYNPVDGYEFNFISSVGNKRIKPNNQILELKDDNDPAFNFGSLYDTLKLKTYQVKAMLAAAKYFPFGSNHHTTIKTAINAGYLASGNIYRNELFQIGGYRLLRGFDEQSQYLSQYAIGSLEYRYLVGQNSYFNVFADGGWGINGLLQANNNYTYISGGLGMAFETKVGIFNLAWALGKRNDSRFNLRQSKIHFGFINYF